MAISIEAQIESVSNEELMKMTESELRKWFSNKRDALNKNLKRIMQAGKTQESGAYKYAMETGGWFSTKNKNRNQLLAEIFRAKKFASMKSSSLSKMTKTAKELAIQFKISTQLMLDGKSRAMIFSLYHQMEMDDYAGSQIYGYKELIKNIANRVANKESKQSIIAGVKKDIDKKHDELIQRINRTVEGTIWRED